MSEEERQYARLKSSYTVYQSLLSNHTLPYLLTRLVALFHSLGALESSAAAAAAGTGTAGASAGAAAGEEEGDDLSALSAVYFDVLETLPALAELRAALDSLTASIYADWRALQDVRKAQGVCCVCCICCVVCVVCVVYCVCMCMCYIYLYDLCLSVPIDPLSYALSTHNNTTHY